MLQPYWLAKLRVATFCQCQTGTKELLKCTYNCEIDVGLESQIAIDRNYLYVNCGYYPKEILKLREIASN